MDTNEYVTRIASTQWREISMSDTVTILSDPEEEPTHRRLFSDRLRSKSTLQIQKEDQKVTDVTFERVEEIRSVNHGNLLQVSGKSETYFVKFRTREALESWLDYLKRALRVSDISRGRPYHSERHIRPRQHQDVQKKHLSTQHVEQHYSRQDNQRNRRRDGVIYDSTSSTEDVSAFLDASSLVSDDYVNTTFDHTITTGPRTKLVIGNVHGNLIIHGDGPKDHYLGEPMSSSTSYEALRPPQATTGEYHSLRQTHNIAEKTMHRMAEESDWGPVEGMFEAGKLNYLDEGEYDYISPAVPARPMATKVSQIKKEQQQGIVNLTVGQSGFKGVKFSSRNSFVYISDTPKNDHSFYVGDKVQSINGHDVGGDTAFVERLINTSLTKEVVFTLKRLPEAEIGMIRRHSSDQNIGVTLKDTKIKRVVRGSLFSEKFGHGCHRCVTHINGTYFRYGTSAETVHKFLAECGVEVVLVLQPSNFVKELTHGIATGKEPTSNT